jgi:hypothetical protein
VSTAAPAIATVTPTTTAAFHLGASLVYVQRASADLAPVESGDGLVSIFRARHFHEPEAAGAASIPVGHDADAVHLPIRREKLAQFFFPGIEVEVANKNVLQANASE